MIILVTMISVRSRSSKSSSNHCFTLLKSQRVIQTSLMAHAEHPTEPCRRPCLSLTTSSPTLRSSNNKLRVVFSTITQVFKTQLRQLGILLRSGIPRRTPRSCGLRRQFSIHVGNGHTLRRIGLVRWRRTLIVARGS